jgi:hypothetical protein
MSYRRIRKLSAEPGCAKHLVSAKYLKAHLKCHETTRKKRIGKTWKSTTKETHNASVICDVFSQSMKSLVLNWRALGIGCRKWQLQVTMTLGAIFNSNWHRKWSFLRLWRTTLAWLTFYLFYILLVECKIGLKLYKIHMPLHRCFFKPICTPFLWDVWKWAKKNSISVISGAIIVWWLM